MLYQNSLIIFYLAIVFLPLVIFKEVGKYTLPLFYVLIFLSVFLRPYILGIDNANYIELFSGDIERGEYLKYGLLYILAYPFPGGWHKLLVINIISTFTLLFSFKKLLDIQKLKFGKSQPSLILIYYFYILLIMAPLMLVHFRQYLGLGIIFYLIFINKKINYSLKVFQEIFLNILLLLLQPVYFPFSLFYLSSNYFSPYISKVITNSSKLFKFVVTFIISFITIIFFLKADQVLIYIAQLLPGYYDYGIQRAPEFDSSTGYGGLYLLLLPFPILIFRILSKEIYKAEYKYQFFINLSLYFLFSVPFISIELLAPFLYSVGRVKSSLYPALFILLANLFRFRINKNIALIPIFLSLLLVLFNFYKLTINLGLNLVIR